MCRTVLVRVTRKRGYTVVWNRVWRWRRADALRPADWARRGISAIRAAFARLATELAAAAPETALVDPHAYTAADVHLSVVAVNIFRARASAFVASLAALEDVVAPRTTGRPALIVDRAMTLAPGFVDLAKERRPLGVPRKRQLPSVVKRTPHSAVWQRIDGGGLAAARATACLHTEPR